MDRRTFLRTAATSGLLVSAAPFVLAQAENDEDPYEAFFSLPIYRAYLRGIQFNDLPDFYAEDLEPPQALDLVREPDNRRDRKAVAVYHNGLKLGYLPQEDNVVLSKLIRRGLPVRCRLIGVQPEEEDFRLLSVEVALLYPPHATSNATIEKAEKDRMEGLQYVKNKPTHKLHASGDPLSLRHVWDGYFR